MITKNSARRALSFPCRPLLWTMALRQMGKTCKETLENRMLVRFDFQAFPSWMFLCLNVLAAQDSLNLPGRRKELIGLAHREMLARLRVDVIDEARQITTGLRYVVGLKIGLHSLQLTIEAGLDALG